MYSIRSKKLVILGFFIIVELSCSVALSETFRVLLPIIPKLNPYNNQINVGNYIGIHLYYPLFRVSEKGDIKSNFLDLSETKALGPSFMSYQFCLRPSVNLSDNTDISVEDFKQSMLRFSSLYPQLAPIDRVDAKTKRCIEVKLKFPVPNFFKKLTGIASTIVKQKDLKENYPVGYGPYKISRISENEISLEITEMGNLPFYDKIIFSTLSKSKDYDDFNQFPTFKRDDVNYELDEYTVNTLKTYAHVLNLKSSNERSCINFYLKKINWNQLYELDIIKNNRFVPALTPLLGLRNNLSHVGCARIKHKIPYLMVDFFNLKKVSNKFKEIGLDKYVEIKKLTPKEFADFVFSGKEYVGMMSFDSSSSIISLESDYSSYFESFISKENRVITVSPVEVKTLFSLLSSKFMLIKERTNILENIEVFLMTKNFISPIGILRKKLYFKKGISIKNWADYYSGYPYIYEIEHL